MTGTEFPADRSRRDLPESSIEQAVAVARRLGFCLLKGFFEPGEIAAWEQAAVALDEADRRRDFLSHGRLDSLLFDERVLALARSLIGPKLVYYGETNCALDGEPFREWHFDARGTPGDINAFYDVAPGEIHGAWRFGIYFRDYRISSGGLKVGPGSHLWPVEKAYTQERQPAAYPLTGGVLRVSDFPFATYNVPSEPGDLVIFNLRTCHSGNFVRLKERLDVSLAPELETVLLRKHPGLFAAAPPGQRNALFFDYASPELGPDLYIKWRANRILGGEAMSDPALYTYDRHEIRTKAEAHGISFRYDRIIAQLLHKRRACGSLDSDDQLRLQALIALNQEFSPFHSLRTNLL